MKNRRIEKVAVAACLLVLFACAHVRVVSPISSSTLLAEVCGASAPGYKIQGVKGTVWLQAKSSDAYGRFPAIVEVTSPDSLKMEVTNLIGAPEAMISVRGRHYLIQVPKRNGEGMRTKRGVDSWSGIPLRWATDLFLGKIPCPSSATLQDAKVALTSDGDLVVETQASLSMEPEKFKYRFRKWAGRFWPEALEWERLGPFHQKVDFKFDRPEDKTQSPLKWEAQSSQGEIKVRWRERNVTPLRN